MRKIFLSLMAVFLALSLIAGDGKALAGFGESLSTTVQGKTAEPDRIALQGGTLVDVESGNEIADSVVLIEGDRIRSVGREGEVSIPPNTVRMDARGKWIISGLADMHAHLFGYRYRRAGVQLLAGTDSWGLGKYITGPSLHRELELLCDSGLTPLEALRAATLTAARALRKEGEIGSLKPEAFADLVVLNADPLADIRNVRKIHVVMKGARTYEPAPAVLPE